MTSITPRKLHFNFDGVTRFWLNASPVATYHFNVFALFIPNGEAFFMKSVQHFIDQITDPVLLNQTKAFIKQEGNHRREHLKYSVHAIFKFYPKLKSNPYQFRLTKLIALLGGSKFRLAMTAAGEHFTAILADYYLRHPEQTQNIPEPVKNLWHWHFVEEIEHKAVAFDVLRAIKVGYCTRTLGYLFMSWFFIIGYLLPFFHMARIDKQLTKWSFYKSCFAYFLTKPGILRHLFKPYIAYFKPTFHPWQIDNNQLIDKLKIELQK